uniref:Aminomethyltransferase n=1 Tax=Mastigamoeba balamuthi TaxID=108607 RepID=A0A0B5CXB8_MASBA|nr:mitochondrial glycine cleavage system T protein [Mastigamoeba balamuthi]|eukprot:m51a1_g7716 putative glycine cleavage system protein t (396) ;mRNA; r:121473-123770
MLSSSAPLSLPARMSSAPSGKPPKRTPMYDLHVKKGGKMIEFCGWSMPVQFEGMGVLKEIELCRKGAAIFDISHMGQIWIYGPGRSKFIEHVTTVDTDMEVGNIRYAVITDANGGALDDSMLCRQPDHLCLVVNAACYDGDIAHLRREARDWPNVVLRECYDTHGMFIIQGPRAEEVVSRFLSAADAATLARTPFMNRISVTLCGVDGVTMSRSGYTGEDGFEISAPRKEISRIVETLSNAPGCGLAGLGARDTLRLEAALTLYGNDMSREINFLEAGQSWALSKRRREEGGFIGAGEILRQLREGVKRKRVGLVIQGAPARDHTPLFDPKDPKKQIGVITSGGPSPTAGLNIGLGLVPTPYAKVGDTLLAQVRGKMLNAKIVKMPFVPHHYKKF